MNRDYFETLSTDNAQMLGAGWGDPMAFSNGVFKALTSSSSADTSLLDGPAAAITALRPEDLSSLLTQYLWEEKDLTLQRWLKTASAFNMDYQWNEQNTYGEEEANIFYTEGAKPISQDDTFTRKTRSVKLTGLEREITLPALFQRTGGGVPDILTHTTKTGVLQLLAGLEKEYFLGRADLHATGQGFDGIEEQMNDNAPADNIIDLRGYALTPGYIDQAIEVAKSNFADIDAMNLFLSNPAVNNFSKPFRTEDFARIFLDSNAQKILAGGGVTGYQSQFGKIPLTPNTFLGRHREKVSLSNYAAAKGGTNAPNPIPLAGFTVSPVVDATSLMSAGTYYYSIVAKNAYGTSTPIYTASGVACAAGERLDLAWSAPLVVPTGGAPTSYLIFRSTTNPNTSAAIRAGVKLMREVAATPRTYSDTNQYMPGCGVGFLLEGLVEDLCIVDLTPLIRISFAMVTTSYKFALLKATDVAVRNAYKNVMFKNMGETV